jgi:hypothetical protein
MRVEGRPATTVKNTSGATFIEDHETTILRFGVISL